MARSEKIYKKLHLLACFMPAIAIILEGILEFSKRTSNIIWIGIFGFDIMLLILSLIMNKNINAKEKAKNKIDINS